MWIQREGGPRHGCDPGFLKQVARQVRAGDPFALRRAPAEEVRRRCRTRCARRQTIVAPLPEGIKGHFGPDLRRFATLTPQGHEALAKVAAAFLASDDRQVAALLASGDVGEVECNGNESG
jgi:hypothetical protein